ncbi:MAG: hypothetical protein ABJA87_14360, partial [bacterium]
GVQYGQGQYGQGSYGDPGSGQTGYGSSPYGPPGSYPPGGPGGPGPSAYGGEPPRRNRSRLIAALAAAALVLALVIVGIVVAVNSNKDSTAKTVSASRSESAPSFSPSSEESTSAPTSESSSPTDTASSTPPSTKPRAPTTDQNAAASIAERFYHAVGANDVSTFCSLVDPVDIKTQLKKKNIPSCARVTFDAVSAPNKAGLKALNIDASKVITTSTTALIFRTSYAPTSIRDYVGAVELRRASASATWKVRFI